MVIGFTCYRFYPFRDVANCYKDILVPMGYRKGTHESMPKTSKISRTKIGFNDISSGVQSSLIVDNDHITDSRHERHEIEWANKNYIAKFLQ